MEQRKDKRYMLDQTIQAINVLDGRSLGILINLSAGGFMLMSGKNGPKRGEILQLHLFDPRERLLDIQAGVTCVWREDAHATDSFWCGFKFIDISADARKMLDEFLASLE